MATTPEQVRLLYRTMTRHFNEGKTSWGKNELVQEIAKVYIAFLEDMDLQETLKTEPVRNINVVRNEEDEWPF